LQRLCFFFAAVNTVSNALLISAEVVSSRFSLPVSARNGLRQTSSGEPGISGTQLPRGVPGHDHDCMVSFKPPTTNAENAWQRIDVELT